MSYMKEWIENLKGDFYVYKIVFGKGIGKYFYFPAIRTVVLFRLSQLFYVSRITRPIAYLITNLNDFLHGIWIGPRVKVGKGFLLAHPRGIIINPDTVIGEYCSILHQVTLGGESIVIGDNVEILAGAMIINDKLHEKKLYVNNGAVIAAGAIILQDVPQNAVMAGVPAKIKKYKEDNQTWLNFRLNLINEEK
jgi:serine acetyltransferase